jgi:hypothetical protein
MCDEYYNVWRKESTQVGYNTKQEQRQHGIVRP